MKRVYRFIFIVTVFLSTISCGDLLHKDPIGLLTSDIINTEPTLAGVQSTVNSSYQVLSSSLNILGDWNWANGLVTRNDIFLYDVGSDDAIKKWNPDGDQPWIDEIHNYSFIASNGGFNGFWSYQYEGVARTNLALSYLLDNRIVEIIGMDEDLRKRLLGEVYFLRAFFYFDLVTNLGDIPHLLKPIKDFNDAYDVVERESKDVVWSQISSDLNDAVANLPDAKFSIASEPWRVSKGAALAMQAKVALYNEDYQTVIAKTEELEQTQFYDLNDLYFDNFSVDTEFTDDEVIFSYNHESGKIPRAGNGLCALLGWGFIAPSESFIAEFEENDPRLILTVNVDQRHVYKILGSLSNVGSGNEDAPSNKVYIRYADVMLWRAEALLETGDISGCVEIINLIRNRARKSANIIGDQIEINGLLPDRDTEGSKEDAFEWLVHERRVELGFESHRLRDLKRWGIAKEVLNANGQGFQDHHILFPIPQKDIDKAGGRLTQNSGYF